MIKKLELEIDILEEQKDKCLHAYEVEILEALQYEKRQAIKKLKRKIEKGVK
ncbi:MAG: hypothetical protein ACRCXT_08690 [Paraclostridium sp.]